MNADKIRENGFDAYATAENRAVVEVLTEIAAQLAEHNELSRERIKLLQESNKMQQSNCDVYVESQQKWRDALTSAVEKEIQEKA